MIKRLWGAVLSDFSAAFDIINHSLLLEEHMCFGFTAPAILWIKSYVSNTQRVFLNGRVQHNPGRIRNTPGQLLRPLTYFNLY
jgi:hypothetical protein